MTALDLDGQDFARSPWDYPGLAASSSGLLRGGHFVAREAYVAPTADRALVVAVGSNASPVVLHRKLAGGGVSTTAPMLMIEVRGIAIGFSAHVSRSGYIPYAPYDAPGRSAVLVAALLDPSQLRCLDRTEPNYQRVWRDDPTCSMVVRDAERSSGYYLYESTWGLLGRDRPVQAPRTQDDLWTWLRETLPDVRRLIAHLPDSRSVMRACARDDRLRTDLRLALEPEVWPGSTRLSDRSSAQGAAAGDS